MDPSFAKVSSPSRQESFLIICLQLSPQILRPFWRKCNVLKVSELWLCHFKTLPFLLMNHVLHPCLIRRFVDVLTTEGLIFWSQMWISCTFYMRLSILTRLPDPLAEKNHCHSIMLSPSLIVATGIWDEDFTCFLPNKRNLNVSQYLFHLIKSLNPCFKMTLGKRFSFYMLGLEHW